MAILKKIKASTLMETLVAFVLIVLVFMISSMVLNNVFYNSVKNDTRAIDTYLSELHYKYINGGVKLPYYDDYDPWQISITVYNNSNKEIEFKASNNETGVTVYKYYEKQN